MKRKITSKEFEEFTIRGGDSSGSAFLIMIILFFGGIGISLLQATRDPAVIMFVAMIGIVIPIWGFFSYIGSYEFGKVKITFTPKGLRYINGTKYSTNATGSKEKSEDVFINWCDILRIICQKKIPELDKECPIPHMEPVITLYLKEAKQLELYGCSFPNDKNLKKIHEILKEISEVYNIEFHTTLLKKKDWEREK